MEAKGHVQGNLILENREIYSRAPSILFYPSSTHSNKDHQRMMVDPMFMIVQSLRSFLTAVTTNAVAPIAVIFTCIYLNIPKVP
jgi:hypothetical protein